MTRVLLVGYDPDAVDYSDPALPPGLNAEKVAAGIALGLRQMRERGWEAESCLIRPDAPAAPAVADRLATQAFDCVVIGGGFRLSTRLLPQFEAVINAVHKAAPAATIAFNTRPEDSAEAAARSLAAG